MNDAWTTPSPAVLGYCVARTTDDGHHPGKIIASYTTREPATRRARIGANLSGATMCVLEVMDDLTVVVDGYYRPSWS